MPGLGRSGSAPRCYSLRPMEIFRCAVRTANSLGASLKRKSRSPSAFKIFDILSTKVSLDVMVKFPGAILLSLFADVFFPKMISARECDPFLCSDLILLGFSLPVQDLGGQGKSANRAKDVQMLWNVYPSLGQQGLVEFINRSDSICRSLGFVDVGASLRDVRGQKGQTLRLMIIIANRLQRDWEDAFNDHFNPLQDWWLFESSKASRSKHFGEAIK